MALQPMRQTDNIRVLREVVDLAVWQQTYSRINLESRPEDPAALEPLEVSRANSSAEVLTAALAVRMVPAATAAEALQDLSDLLPVACSAESNRAMAPPPDTAAPPADLVV